MVNGSSLTNPSLPSMTFRMEIPLMSTSNSKEEISSEVEHEEKVICEKDTQESLDLSF